MHQSVFKRQNGVVLFIALIALVVMSLAAAALIRSVDTNTTIAGNLSFQQSALVSSDRGAESAISWLEAISNANVNANVNALNGSRPNNGYYANYGNLDNSNVNLDDIADVKNDNTWDNFSVPATGAGIVNGLEANSQNTINYIIERMCATDGAPPANDGTNKCLFGAAQAGGGSKLVKTAEQSGAKTEAGLSPIYRVTVRVTGPKNTQSYSQVYVY